MNNAATNPYMGPSIDIDLDRYDKTLHVNLRGPLVWTQLAWNRSMRERGGSVINIASVGGFGVEPSIGIYNTTKAALIYLTRTLAAELAPGVRVNAIAPGLVKTDMARALWEPNEELLAKRMPLRRLGEPDDIGKAALFFASDLSSWITGHTLVVDGGALVRPARLIGRHSAARRILPRVVRGKDSASTSSRGAAQGPRWSFTVDAQRIEGGRCGRVGRYDDRDDSLAPLVVVASDDGDLAYGRQRQPAPPRRRRATRSRRR